MAIAAGSATARASILGTARRTAAPKAVATSRCLNGLSSHVTGRRRTADLLPRPRVVARASGGSGLLDSETIVTPGKSTDGARQKPPIYKVLLHNDNTNRREYVVKVLLRVIEGLSVDMAVTAMQEAHETGVALVAACAQDLAERYVEDLRLNGLVSTMEPGH